MHGLPDSCPPLADATSGSRGGSIPMSVPEPPRQARGRHRCVAAVVCESMLQDERESCHEQRVPQPHEDTMDAHREDVYGRVIAAFTLGLRG